MNLLAPFQLALDSLSEEIRTLFVRFWVQNGVNALQGAPRKACRHLFFVDLSASHGRGYT